jgi:hypothetical protein
LIVACKGDPARVPSPPKAEAHEGSQGPPTLGPTSPASPPSATCLLVGDDDVERSDNLTDVAYFYGFRLADSCATSRLTQALTTAQLADWINYLLNYSSALFDCGLIYSPLPGGIDQFGLSNTDVVGVPSPALGPDDAEALTALYLEICETQLGISQADLVTVRGQLERAAANRVDAALSAQLSECPAL